MLRYSVHSRDAVRLSAWSELREITKIDWPACGSSSRHNFFFDAMMDPSPTLALSLELLVLVMVCLVVFLLYRALREKVMVFAAALAVIIVGIGMQLAVASTGAFSHFEAPPGISKLLLPMLILNVYFSSFSTLGGEVASKLPVRTLVGFQAFRVGPELILHFGYLEGSLPHQMTWRPDGRNFDVAVAVAAAILFVRWTHLARQPIVWAFGIFGVASLVNIFFTAVVSLSHPLRDTLMPHFGAGLEAVARPPFVLLPGVLVQMALCGHLLLFRKLMLPSYLVAAAGAGPEMYEQL